MRAALLATVLTALVTSRAHAQDAPTELAAPPAGSTLEPPGTYSAIWHLDEDERHARVTVEPETRRRAAHARTAGQWMLAGGLVGATLAAIAGVDALSCHDDPWSIVDCGLTNALGAFALTIAGIALLVAIVGGVVWAANA